MFWRILVVIGGLFGSLAECLYAGDPAQEFADGKFCFREFRYSDAQRRFDEAVKARPNDAGAFRCRGAARALNGDFAGSLEDFGSALRLKPSDAVVYFCRSEVHYVLGNFDSAIADVDQVQRLDPARPATKDWRYTIILATGNAEEILRSSSPLKMSPDGENTLWVMMRLAAGDYAPPDFDIETGRWFRLYRLLAYRCWLSLYETRHAHDAGMRDAIEKAAKNPQDATSLRNAGLCCAIQRDLARATANLDRAVALAPNDTKSHEWRSVVRILQGNLIGALDDRAYIIAHETDPRRIYHAYSWRIDIYEQLGDRRNMEREEHLKLPIRLQVADLLKRELDQPKARLKPVP